jgi:hypothetical protein
MAVPIDKLDRMAIKRSVDEIDHLRIVATSEPTPRVPAP